MMPKIKTLLNLKSNTIRSFDDEPVYVIKAPIQYLNYKLLKF